MLNSDYENKQLAKQVNLITFLNAEYPDIIYFDSKKKEWRIKNRNIKISAISFYDFDNCTGGDNIRFLTDYLELTFFEAISKLLSSGVEILTPEKFALETFIKPNWTSNTDEIYDYLGNRNIDKELINVCIQKEKLFLDDKKNLVFANPEQNFYILRSTYSEFKGIRSEEQYGYWILKTIETKDVYIYESPIDILSHIILKTKQGLDTKGIYIAMGGLKKGTIERIKNDYQDYNYFLCIDWDNAGEIFAKNYPDFKRIKGMNGKDWNDELTKYSENFIY